MVSHSASWSSYSDYVSMLCSLYGDASHVSVYYHCLDVDLNVQNVSCQNVCISHLNPNCPHLFDTLLLKHMKIPLHGFNGR